MYGDRGISSGGCFTAWIWYIANFLQQKYNFSFMGHPLTYYMPFLKFCVEWNKGHIVQNMFPMAIGFGLTIYTVLTLSMFASMIKNKFFSGKLVRIPSNFF